MARSNIKYKKVAENAIKLFQKMEIENGDKIVHSYEEWLELLQKDMKEESDEQD